MKRVRLLPSSRSIARFSTTADNSTTVHSAGRPGSLIDLEEKEMCVRYFNSDVRCQDRINDSSFQITEAVATDGVVVVYRLTGYGKTGPLYGYCANSR